MSIDPSGRWQELALESDALRGNPLGDPNVRPVFVWTPPSYDAEPGRRRPAVYVLQGMFGQARAWFNVSPFQKNVPETIDELAPEAIVVLVDGFTSVGGAQWLDSPATAATAPTSATRCCRSSTRASAPPPPASTAASRASPRAGSAR